MSKKSRRPRAAGQRVPSALPPAAHLPILATRCCDAIVLLKTADKALDEIGGSPSTIDVESFAAEIETIRPGKDVEFLTFAGYFIVAVQSVVEAWTRSRYSDPRVSALLENLEYRDRLKRARDAIAHPSRADDNAAGDAFTDDALRTWMADLVDAVAHQIRGLVTPHRPQLAARRAARLSAAGE